MHRRGASIRSIYIIGASIENAPILFSYIAIYSVHSASLRLGHCVCVPY